MKLLTLTALGLLATTSMVSAQDARDISNEVSTVKERNAYDYEFNRDEQCQGYYWGVKRLGFDNPCEKTEEEKIKAKQEKENVENLAKELMRKGTLRE